MSKLNEQVLRQAIGARIRRVRMMRGLTQEGLSSLTGGRFSETAIGGYERGERAVSAVRLCQLARWLEVPPAALLPAPERSANSVRLNLSGKRLPVERLVQVVFSLAKWHDVTAEVVAIGSDAKKPEPGRLSTADDGARAAFEDESEAPLAEPDLHEVAQ